MARSALTKAFAAPFELSKALWAGFPITRKLIRDDVAGFPLHARKTPKLSFNNVLGPDRLHRKLPATMGQFKAMRRLVSGATVNDVVLAIIGGALRRWLAEQGQTVEQSLNVGMPVSIRAKGAEGEAGNQAMLAIVPLGTDIANPVDRLRHINSWTTRKKDYVGDIPAHVMTDFADFIPGMAMSWAVKAFTGLGAARAIKLPFNLIVTNVPASRVPIYSRVRKCCNTTPVGRSGTELDCRM